MQKVTNKHIHGTIVQVVLLTMNQAPLFQVLVNKD